MSREYSRLTYNCYASNTMQPSVKLLVDFCSHNALGTISYDIHDNNLV